MAISSTTAKSCARVRRRNCAPTPKRCNAISQSERVRVDQHLVRRLEAFSDIVFGFSLAQLGVQLAGIGRPQDIANHTADFLIFFCAFATISIFWWWHFRLFRGYFVGAAPDIIINFVCLAAVAIVPYTLHLMLVHGYDPLVAVLYALSTGTFYACLALMLYRGMRYFWPSIDEAERRSVTLRVWRTSCVAAVFLGSTLLYPFGAYAIEFSWLLTIVFMVIIRFRLRRQAPV